jgi:hypothetical protein
MNEVGYKKPPKHTQFAPGKSGNPNGRPKAAKSPAGHELLNQLVTVIQKGKPKKMTVLDAVLTQILRDAMNGDYRARKLALDYAKSSNKAKSPSLPALAACQSPFELTAEDEANIAKHNLLKGVK